MRTAIIIPPGRAVPTRGVTGRSDPYRKVRTDLSESPTTHSPIVRLVPTAGRREEAIRMYDRAVELDPDGPTGQNARERLRGDGG